MRKRRILPILAGLVLAVAGLALVGAPGAQAAVPDWASPEDAAIHPGVQMITDGAQCTANFVFTDADAAVYLGYAAHCAGLGFATETDGCVAETHPVGTEVTIAGSDGEDYRGTLAYSSWIAMQDVLASGGSVPEEACAYNDFALVRLADADIPRTNPTMPHWGGPTGLDTEGTEPMSSVYSYGNSGLRLGLRTLSPKEGISLGTSPEGWTHTVYTLSPGIPGDSGSGLLDAEGEAAGVLSTVAITPLPASNNFSDLASALGYLEANSDLAGVTLQEGETAFDPAALPLGV